MAQVIKNEIVRIRHGKLPKVTISL
jgi:hypothetical protein